MHYLGAITEQLTQPDSQEVALARRHANQRRDARRASRHTPGAHHPLQASLIGHRGQESTGGGKLLRFFDWHGILAHHH